MVKFSFDEAKTVQAVVIGGGSAGIASARELAKRGVKVLLIEKHSIGKQTSGQTPGRFGFGHHYADKATALSCLRSSLMLYLEYPGYLVGLDREFDHPIRRGRYYITKDSDHPPAKILEIYREIQRLYTEIYNTYPGRFVAFPPPEQFIRVLQPHEYALPISLMFELTQ